MVDEKLVPLLEEMLYELYNERLEVCLVPNKDPDKQDRMLRAAYSKNPDWYRKLCKDYPSNRTKKRIRKKDDTKIRRKMIIGVLYTLINKRRSWSQYAPYLIDVAKSREELYYKYKKQEEVQEQPWNNQF